MNKDDVIKIIINGDKETVSLAWDDNKSVVFYRHDFDNINLVEDNAIATLWRVYGDEIIEYISNKSIEEYEKDFDNIDFSIKPKASRVITAEITRREKPSPELYLD